MAMEIKDLCGHLNADSSARTHGGFARYRSVTAFRSQPRSGYSHSLVNHAFDEELKDLESQDKLGNFEIQYF